MKLPELFEEYRLQFVLGLMGLFLLGVGILSVVFLSRGGSGTEVEIITADEVEGDNSSELVVDVEGAVERPGIYKLAAKSRVNDALAAAGGLAVDADRDWISKNINLAHILTDGIKVYIPSEQEEIESSTSNKAAISQGGDVIGLSTSSKININSAGTGELDSLWGIGEARAASIISNRPYTSVQELLEKNIIPSNVYERIKNDIVAL